jgi:hypothetical protein
VAYAAGTSQPATSNVNLVQGQVQANEVVTRVGTGANAGKVTLRLSRGAARLIVDVVGAVVPTAGNAGFTALDAPVRVLDSRRGLGTTTGKKTASSTVSVAVPAGVPADATGLVLNVTTTGAATGDSGFVVVYPGGGVRPSTSNVNWRAGVNQANEVITGLGTNGRVQLAVGGGQANAGVHLIADVVGYLR